MKSDSEDTVFVLIPRQDAITKLSHVNKMIESLSALNKAKGFAKKCWEKQITVPEGNNLNYVTVGLKPNTGSPGILDSWPKKLSAENKDRVIKLMNGCQEVANGYLPCEELRGIQIAKRLSQWLEMEGCGPQSV
jgi:hypothetical protein